MEGDKQSSFYLEEGIWEALGIANDMWDEMTKCIRKVAKEALYESRGLGTKGRES